MRILIACEFSGAVRDAFIRQGHNAISCDLLPSVSNLGQHIIGDVIPLLTENWDMIIAFPPCTHLAVSGAKHFKKKIADGRQQQGIDFFMHFTKCKCPFAIENPVGIMSTKWRKPDQIIQPYQFGDSFQKKTCLWLNKLPKLEYTKIVDKGKISILKSGKKIPEWYSNSNHKTRKYDRAITFPGIAKAMAKQWGKQ